MNVFAYNTYKEFLKAYIMQNELHGIISQVASACGCDRTYISQVLNGKAELTPDHIIQFCEYLSLNETETNYILLLSLRDRSASIKARKSLDIRIKQIKKDGLTVSHKVLSREKPEEISNEQRTLYYSSWLYGAIHILTSIKEFQIPTAIAQKLQLPVQHINHILKDLLKMNVIRIENDRYIHNGSDVYLPQQHPQSLAHHLGWRMKAVERAMVKEDIHYTVAYSVSINDVEKLRLQIIQLIEDQRKFVHNSGAEVACGFCVDFFTF